MIIKQRQIPGIVWNSWFKQILVCQTDTCLPNRYMFVLVHVPWSDTKKGADQGSDLGSWLEIFD